MEYEAPKKKNQGAVDTLSNIVLGDFTVDAPMPQCSVVPPSNYFPETSEWGFTEIELLVCDGCKLWVHAGCAGISEDEYNETSEGEHAIYSKEFLCRVCCRQRCKDIIRELREQASLGAFAVPVTEKVAPNYHDVIQIPMDLQTMQERAESEEYLNYAWVRESFELIVLNALTFNNFVSRFVCSQTVLLGRPTLMHVVSCSTQSIGMKRDVFIKQAWIRFSSDWERLRLLVNTTKISRNVLPRQKRLGRKKWIACRLMKR